MSSASTTGVDFIYTVRDEFPFMVSDEFPIVIGDKIETP
jgi:hypothetical protein